MHFITNDFKRVSSWTNSPDPRQRVPFNNWAEGGCFKRGRYQKKFVNSSTLGGGGTASPWGQNLLPHSSLSNRIIVLISLRLQLLQQTCGHVFKGLSRRQRSDSLRGILVRLLALQDYCPHDYGPIKTGSRSWATSSSRESSDLARGPPRLDYLTASDN